MKKKGYLAFAALLLATCVLAQEREEVRTKPRTTTASGPFADIWSVALDSSHQADQAAQSITQLANGTLVSAGLDAYQPNSCRGQIGGAWVIAVTPDGSNVFQKLYSNCSSADQWAKFVRATSDGGFILSGEDNSTALCQPCAWIAKFDGSGNISWQEDLTTFTNSGVNIKTTADGGYIAAGYSQSSSTTPLNGLVMKLSPTGASQWTETFTETATSFQNAVVNSNGGFGLNSIAPTPDGGYIVSGVADAKFSSGFAHVVAVIKVDSAGKVQWSRVYYSNTWGSWVPGDSLQYPVFATADGGYTVSGTVEALTYPYQNMFFLMHLDSKGNVLWQKAYGGVDQSTGRNKANAVSATATSDGGYVLAGYASIFLQEWDGWLVKTDSQGNIQWQNSYSGTEPTGSNDVRFNEIIQTADGNYAAAGSSYVGSLTYGGPGFFVARTDPQGGIGTCACAQPTQTAVQALDLQAHAATFTQTSVTPVFTPTNIAGKTTSVSPTILFP